MVPNSNAGSALPTFSLESRFAALPATLSIREACRELNYGQTTVWGLVKAGELEPVRSKGRTTVTTASVFNLLCRLIAASKQAA